MTSPNPAPEARNLLRRPVHPDITEEMIRALVHTFYDKVRADAVLGPIFDRVIGERWDDHLAKMCDFWSSVTLVSGRYKGRPLPAHMRLKDVRPEHFTQWLALFRKTAKEVCPPDIAAVFIERAQRIAESFQLGMFFHPGGPLSVPPAPQGTAP
ncbi:group III truncated hemoglobin [Pelagibius sp. CAU 1746]|uniref:group III truncated hemoglobin n=1 Tax=Pelagibius sp. CAU 1746 TaxID=3140370 RepID=UPI00325C1E1C